MDTHCVGFPPSIDAGCRVLVLGSMPSVKSLAAQQYYAHPQNRFWPLMALLLTGAAEPPADYGERLRLLLSHHIALWDAIASCERAGSLDTAIHEERGNDFTSFLAAHPAIHTICFNGAKSYQCFRRYNQPLLSRAGLAFHQLPSTSPANAAWQLERLTARWQTASISSTRYARCTARTACP